MKKTNLFALAMSILCVSSLTSCGETNVGLATDGILTVGMECAYAPFNWTETSQSETNVAIDNVKNAYAEGYDIQVAKIIAEELNLTLKIKAFSWDGLITSLNSNQIDLIIAGMSPTEKRKETIDFTDGYYRSTHVLLVKEDSKFATAKMFDDFKGANIIGQTGTLYASLIPQVTSHGAIQGVNLDTVPEIVNAINMGTADITILEEPVAKGICAQYDGLTYVKLDEPFEVDEADVLVSIGVRKGFNLTSNINNILKTTLTESKRVELMEQAISLAPSEM